jgi:hypothetical protein
MLEILCLELLVEKMVNDASRVQIPTQVSQVSSTPTTPSSSQPSSPSSDHHISIGEPYA